MHICPLIVIMLFDFSPRERHPQTLRQSNSRAMFAAELAKVHYIDLKLELSREKCNSCLEFNKKELVSGSFPF